MELAGFGREDALNPTLQRRVLRKKAKLMEDNGIKRYINLPPHLEFNSQNTKKKIEPISSRLTTTTTTTTETETAAATPLTAAPATTTRERSKLPPTRIRGGRKRTLPVEVEAALVSAILLDCTKLFWMLQPRYAKDVEVVVCDSKMEKCRAICTSTVGSLFQNGGLFVMDLHIPVQMTATLPGATVLLGLFFTSQLHYILNLDKTGVVLNSTTKVSAEGHGQGQWEQIQRDFLDHQFVPRFNGVWGFGGGAFKQYLEDSILPLYLDANNIPGKQVCVMVDGGLGQKDPKMLLQLRVRGFYINLRKLTLERPKNNQTVLCVSDIYMMILGGEDSSGLKSASAFNEAFAYEQCQEIWKIIGIFAFTRKHLEDTKLKHELIILPDGTTIDADADPLTSIKSMKKARKKAAEYTKLEQAAKDVLAKCARENKENAKAWRIAEAVSASFVAIADWGASKDKSTSAGSSVERE
eukprot:jgi/Psemu1/32591/gm1.32591_g